MSWNGSNRRKFPRVLFPCLIKIRCEKNQEEAYLTHTENLSIGGVRIILKNPIELTVLIDVEIDLMDTDEVFKCRGKVVWLQKRKANSEFKPNFYDIGVEFEGLDKINKDRLEKIISHHLKQGNQE